MAANEAEYMTSLRELNSLTADKMKLILRAMNDTIGCRLKLSGLKADIVSVSSLR